MRRRRVRPEENACRRPNATARNLCAWYPSSGYALASLPDLNEAESRHANNDSSYYHFFQTKMKLTWNRVFLFSLSRACPEFYFSFLSFPQFGRRAHKHALSHASIERSSSPGARSLCSCFPPVLSCSICGAVAACVALAEFGFCCRHTCVSICARSSGSSASSG